MRSIGDILTGDHTPAGGGRSVGTAVVGRVTTGFPDLDTLLTGFKPGDLIVVAARTGLGKTSLVLNFARNAARQGASVAFFTMEMAVDQLVQRMMAMESGVDSRRVALVSRADADENKILEAKQLLSMLPISFCDATLLTLADVREKLLQPRRVERFDLVVVDRLQLLTTALGATNEGEDIRRITRTLKELARDLKVPIIACSEVSRAVQTRSNKVPQLGDLPGSGAIEEVADTVIFLHCEDKYINREEWQRQHPDRPVESYPAGITQIVVAKHRNGPTGTIHLRFREKIARFEDLLVREPEEWEGEDA